MSRWRLPTTGVRGVHVESEPLYGVVETVPKFNYDLFLGNRRVRRTYEGHCRAVAAFASKHEAVEYASTLKRKKHDRWGGSYLTIQERAYKCDTLAAFEIMPVDVMPAVQVPASV